MSLSIGDGGLPPIYPTPPASGGNTGEGDSTPPPSEDSSGDGGPDAVYEPGTPDDGEPLTYSFPQGTSSSGSSAGDGEGETPETGDVGSSDEGVDSYAASGGSDEGTEPTAEGASDGDDGSVDPYASEDAGEEPSYGDYGASDGETSGGDVVDPYAEGASGNGNVDPYAEGASEGGESGSEDYGVGGESEGGDPYGDYGATDGGEGSYDYGAYGDGSGDVAGEGYGDGAIEDESVDPYAAGNPDEEGMSDTGEIADAAADAAVVAQPPVAAAADPISRAAQKEVAQKEAATVEAAKPSLASALGQSRQHVSLAAQLGKVSSAGTEAPDSVAPATSEPIYVPARFTRVTQVAAAKTGSLLSPAQDPAAATQPEAPKAAASVVAQAAYTMVGEAQRLDRSVLSLLKFG